MNISRLQKCYMKLNTKNKLKVGIMSLEVNDRPPNGKRIRHDSLHPIFAPQSVSIVCVGAGVSGIALAITLQQTLENYTLEIFEKNSDVGGTWFENRYPGCACKNLLQIQGAYTQTLTVSRRCSCPCVRLHFRT